MAEPVRPDVDRAAVRRTLLRVAGTVAMFGLLYAVAPFDADRWYLYAVVGLAVVAAFIAVVVRRAHRIRTSERAVLDSLEALGLALSLLIFGFASVHYLLALDGQFRGLETKIDAVYFTVVTIGTVGYGDITPIGQGARVAVTLQILFTLTVVGAAIRIIGGLAFRSRDGRT